MAILPGIVGGGVVDGGGVVVGGATKTKITKNIVACSLHDEHYIFSNKIEYQK